MSLRMLLGYNPNDRDKRASFGSSPSLRTDPVAMAGKGTGKYHVPMSRVQRLPPIKEEASPGNTPRDTTPRNSRYMFPGKHKPTFHVRPLPPERKRTSPPPPPPPDDKPQFALYKTSKPLQPLDVNNTLVDGLVADYLHYARYGHVIPVYEGTSQASCPCCTERNRDNIRTLLGYPKKEMIPKYHTHVGDFKSLTELKAKDVKSKALALSTQSKQQSWMNYQPMPYATNYLNPEFNRPVEVYSYFNSQPPASQAYIANKVLDADTKFDAAMGKLENFSFQRTSYPEYFKDM